ncbi:MAG: hypothetical protein K2O59_04420 [Lachnospiraceae bacterium]|nr:hypothetical protein [Lachnospiraceae bacterium]
MIYKILLRSKNSFVVKASSAIIGIYAGYFLWYILTRFFPEAAACYKLIVSFISVVSSTFLAIYYLPDQFCTNRCIKDILCYPVPTKLILCTLLVRMIILQFEICMAMTYPQFLFRDNNWLSAMKNILTCMVVVCAMDFAIILFAVIISRVFARQIVGYAFVVFQYISFLLLALFIGNMIALGLSRPDFLQWLNEKTVSIYFFLFVTSLAVLLGIAMTIVFKHWYVKGYLNIQSFHKQVPRKHDPIIRIEHPYFLIEWKRVLQNKELIFFSNFKNVITVIVLCRLLVKNFGQIALDEKYALEIFLLVSCCGTNTISSTAYSSDSNRKFYAILPISPRRMFLWKTLQGFLHGEIMVFLLGLGIIVMKDIPALDFWLLFAYGTSMNYACSWLGVFLDFRMPRTVNSTNELLHGNISKVIVLIAAAAITIGCFYLANNHIVSAPLLPSLIAINVFVVSLELYYWLFCKGAFL